MFKYGYRIRPANDNLLLKFYAGLILFISVICVSLLNCVSIMRKDIQIGTYEYITIIIAVGVGILTAFCHYRYRYDDFKQLQHRQLLSRMILDNGWCDTETVEFFEGLGKRDKITNFPKMYYKMENGLIKIRVQITLGKHQEQLLTLEKKLESGLYCELVEKELLDGYVQYTLLYDVIADRIGIEEVEAKDGKLLLMKNLEWEYDSLPHALICGGTGGGKTYFILTIIETLLRTNAQLYILDPKNADLADLGAVMPNVFYKKDDMIQCIDEFYENMMKRQEEMKTMPNYVTGKNYAFLGLEPHFLIFDEYVAFMATLDHKTSGTVLSQLMKIVMLGRQAGFFIILACQRPDAKYFSDGIRDQFNFRVALGKVSEMGYGMMFGTDCAKQFFYKKIKGRGYVDNGMGVISEFYTPKVSKKHDFMKTISDLVKERQSSSADEVKADED